MTYLDTHTAAYLYQRDLDLFGKRALQALERDHDFRISPMAVLELEYLREIKRLKVDPSRILSALAAEIGLTVCDAPFAEVVQAARRDNWTRDPFDRLILAQARMAEATIVTRDERMQAHYTRAIG